MAWINRNNRAWILPTLLLLSTLCAGQDTLPDFKAVFRPGKKVQISWINQYGNQIRQLSIQRSRDSQRLFKTIITIPDPTVLRNGYIDQKETDSNYYYRLYILLDSGRYVFSSPRKPTIYIPPPVIKEVIEKPVVVKEEPIKTLQLPEKPPRPLFTEEEKGAAPILEKTKEPIKKSSLPPPPEKMYTIKRGDTLAGQLSDVNLKRFRDSVTLKTKDTITLISKDTIFIKPFNAKDIYKLSRYIFIDKSGVLHVELPDATKKRYLVRFYEVDKTFLFELKNIRDNMLLLDKANFQHAGWFLFEIYNDGNLFEKNRFYINKDF
ncbi:hypothetical protein [Flavihumibacter fluvii]|uniref:hypothetical protein n=1 Tax=Flavihumibacter fluvii TaxID=2838157 RepID=UPI001BDE5B48|nr:hypothetical protein [Flavihumibacter fluvii]ULQ53672.1 hypothetical protein KJS93_04965 [Flavihumibacter fluvii]